jgi:hypothetical protein
MSIAIIIIIIIITPVSTARTHTHTDSKVNYFHCFSLIRTDTGDELCHYICVN